MISVRAICRDHRTRIRIVRQPGRHRREDVRLRRDPAGEDAQGVRPTAHARPMAASARAQAASTWRFQAVCGLPGRPASGRPGRARAARWRRRPRRRARRRAACRGHADKRERERLALAGPLVDRGGRGAGSRTPSPARPARASAASGPPRSGAGTARAAAARARRPARASRPSHPGRERRREVGGSAEMQSPGSRPCLRWSPICA